MEKDQTPFPVLESMYRGLKIEAGDLLDCIEEASLDLAADVRNFRTKLQKLEQVRTELGLLSE